MKSSVIRYAAEQGVTVKPEEIDDVIELEGCYVEKYKSLLVRFRSDRVRDHFVEAKIAAIDKNKKV